MKEKLLPLIISLVAAAGLFGLGYELSYTKHQALLEICRRLAQQESSRANQLAALNRRLEERLTEAKQENQRQLQAEAAAKNSSRIKTSTQRRGYTLHKGRALVLEEGNLILVLEGIDLSPRRAAIKVKVVGAGERVAVLKPGSNLGIKLLGEAVTLVVRSIHASSVVVTVLGP